MTKFFLILMAIAVVTALIFFLLWRISRAREKELKTQLKDKDRQLATALENQTRLENTIDIMAKNRREADEKINNLHSGSAVGNALDELHKH